MYQIAKMPRSSNVVYDLDVSSIEEARKWGYENLDPTCRHIILENGVNKGDVFQFTKYKHVGEYITSRVFNTNANRTMWFDTKEEAKQARKDNEEEANKLMDAKVELFNSLFGNDDVCIYVQDGLLTLEVCVNGYSFTRYL